MCPYYDENRKICAIYKTTQNSSNELDYCKECRYSYKECPNYRQVLKVYGGNPPAPSYYK